MPPQPGVGCDKGATIACLRIRHQTQVTFRSRKALQCSDQRSEVAALHIRIKSRSKLRSKPTGGVAANQDRGCFELVRRLSPPSHSRWSNFSQAALHFLGKKSKRMHLAPEQKQESPPHQPHWVFNCSRGRPHTYCKSGVKRPDQGRMSDGSVM